MVPPTAEPICNHSHIYAGIRNFNLSWIIIIKLTNINFKIRILYTIEKLSLTSGATVQRLVSCDYIIDNNNKSKKNIQWFRFYSRITEKLRPKWLNFCFPFTYHFFWERTSTVWTCDWSHNFRIWGILGHFSCETLIFSKILMEV